MTTSDFVVGALLVVASYSTWAKLPSERVDHTAAEPVEVLVADTTVRWNRRVFLAEAELRITITNATDESLWYHACGEVLERLVDGAGERVWAGACVRIVGEYRGVEIPAQGRHERLLSVLWDVDPSRWDLPVDGEYRLLVELSSDPAGDVALPHETRWSAPFHLSAAIDSAGSWSEHPGRG